MIKNALEELKAHPYNYFEHDYMVALEQKSVYRGLYWDTYRYKASFSDGVKYMYIKISNEVDNLRDSAKRSKLQQNIRASYQNLSQLYEGFKPFPGYSVIKPITCFPEWFTLITEECSGIDVWTIIRAKAKFYPSHANLRLLEKYCRASGKWLALFQQITRKPDLDPYDFTPIIEYYDSRLSKLVHYQNSPFPEELRKHIINFCQRLVVSIPDHDRTVSGIHNDFAPVNILIANDNIIVLDIGIPQYGVAYWDSTYFYYHLSTLLEIPIYRHATVIKLQQAFMQGFGIPLDPSKNVVTVCMIHNIIQSLLYLAEHRKGVKWYKKLLDRMLYKKHIRTLREMCKF